MEINDEIGITKAWKEGDIICIKRRLFMIVIDLWGWRSTNYRLLDLKTGCLQQDRYRFTMDIQDYFKTARLVESAKMTILQ